MKKSNSLCSNADMFMNITKDYNLLVWMDCYYPRCGMYGSHNKIIGFFLAYR